MTHVERLHRRGILRLGSPATGFRHRRADGEPMTARERRLVESLVIPPAWTDVAISRSPRAMLQAVGRDRAGRWQYLYSEPAVRARDRRKYRRLLRFAEALPSMRRTVDRDLRRRGLPRERVLACVLRILASSFLRPGSEVYVDENGSYGLCTLRRRHVSLEGDRLVLEFPGKGGRTQRRELRDPRAARVVARLLEQRRGRKLFRFEARDEDGGARWVDVRRRHLNAYIKDAMGERFSAKDFRTWAGTLVCASALARATGPGPLSESERRRRLVAAVRETADLLGNTPAVCRASYIHPRLLDEFERGRVVDRWFESVEELLEGPGRVLHPSERALLALLRERAA